MTAFADEIPEDLIDKSEIYYGEANAFENPAGVDMGIVIRATPEYQEIKKKKIDRGTGRYWILYSQATDRANQAITEVAEESEYDLVAGLEYLSSCEVESDDITELVVEKIEEEQ